MAESSSKKRSTTLCENCIFCEKVTDIYEHIDISKILDNSQQCDIKEDNLCKKLLKDYKYECLVCFFKTNKLIEWKCHIMSISHLAYCHKMSGLYSHVCDIKGCKQLLYGPLKSLKNHIKSHLNNSMKTVRSVSICMAGIIKRFIANEPKPWFYCSFCNINSCTQNHPKQKKNCAKKKLDHCKLCNLTFCSSSRMINYHSISVEHMTIKCFDELLSKAKNNSKKIKRTKSLDKSKEHITLTTREVCMNDKNILIRIENTQITKPIQNNKINTRIQWPNPALNICENNDNNIVQNSIYEKEQNLGTTCTDSSLDTFNNVPTTTNSNNDYIHQLVYVLSTKELRKIIGYVNNDRTKKNQKIFVSKKNPQESVLHLLSASSTNTETLRKQIMQVYNSRPNSNHNLQQPPSQHQQPQLNQSPQQAPTTIQHQNSSYYFSNPNNQLQTFNETSTDSVEIALFKNLPFFKMVCELWTTSTFPSNVPINISRPLCLAKSAKKSILRSWNNKRLEYKIKIILLFFQVGIDNIVHDNVTEQLPKNLTVTVNDLPCELPEFIPVNITQQSDLSQSSTNTIKITWSNDRHKYKVGLFLAQKLTCSDLLVELKKRPVRPFKKTKELIKTSMESDADLGVNSIEVTLKDPLSKTRMKLPARGVDCIHLQCFDAIQFLQMNEQKETWTCPLCKKKTKFESIEVDGFFLKILQSTNLSEECENVFLLKDGSWTADFSNRSKVSYTLSTNNIGVINLSDSDEENIPKAKYPKNRKHHEESVEKVENTAEITENNSINQQQEKDKSPSVLCVITLD